jgi:hypothetical protein
MVAVSLVVGLLQAIADAIECYLHSADGLPPSEDDG